MLITLDFSVGEGDSFEAVHNGLTAQYGEPDQIDPSRFLDVVNAIGDMGYTAEEMDNYAGWTLPDGTLASLTYYAEDAFLIAYENAVALNALLASGDEDS